MSTVSPPSTAPHPTFAEAFRFWLKLGFISFGGPTGQIAIMHTELVERRRWISEPRLLQQAVDAHGWLTTGQMIDGLGLAESTPGPLIMVLQFVGFMAGWHHATDLGVAGAVLGGLTATYFTFMPCFLWIFLGAPYVELGRGNRVMAGALATITAAVVGVVLNLAAWFAAHVLVPHGRLDVFALVLAVAAFVALQRFGWSIVPVVLGAAGLGLIYRMIA